MGDCFAWVGAGGKKKKGGAKAKGKPSGASASLPAYCGGGEGFADVATLTSKALKALKLTHESVWVRSFPERLTSWSSGRGMPVFSPSFVTTS